MRTATTRRPGRSLWGFLALLCAAFVLVLAPGRPAWAHAVATGTAPADGAAVEAPPPEVTVTFNEPVQATPGSLRVFDAAGERVDRGDDGPGDTPTVVRVSLDQQAGPGTYTMAWSVLSSDGHVVRGAAVFGVGAEPGTGIAVDAVTNETRGFSLVADVVRWLRYSTTILATGGFLFLAYVTPVDLQPGRRVLALCAGLGVLATLLALPLQAATVSGLGASALVDPAAIRPVWEGTIGPSVLAGSLGLVAVALGVLGLPRRSALALGVAGVIAAAGGFALTGHTATATPRGIAAVANVAHVLAASVWFAGLVLLPMVAAVVRRRRAAAAGARVVQRFSDLAFTSVGLLVVAGILLARVQLNSPGDLVGTRYGITLLVKIAVVLVVLLFAVYNRRRLVPLVSAGGERGWNRLVGIVRLEAVGIVIVLVATTVLTATVPAREMPAETGPVAVRVENATHALDLVVDPARAGVNDFHLYLFDAEGRVVDDVGDAVISFTQGERGIGPVQRAGTAAGPGHWVLRGDELSVPGLWTVAVEIFGIGAESILFEAEVTIGG